jgi:hypothetical protein
MMAIRISIAMTTFNGERFLCAQLESFLAQSRQPDELVACDDGSTDATLELLDAFAKSAPFEVRVVRNPTNLGHERNFAQAIELCSGDLIFLADQDDSWCAEKIAIVEQAFTGDPDALLVVNDVLITDEDLVPTGRTVLGQMRAAGVLGRNWKSLTLGCATAFQSRLRRLIAPIPPLEYGHDYWIHEFTEMVGGRRVLPRVLQLYRRHGQNASTWAFNGSGRATPLDVMRPSAGKDLSPEYAKRCRALSLMLQRVRALGPEQFAQMHAPCSYDQVVDDLIRATAAVERRSGVFRESWLGRKALALRLLLGGDYRYFFGWRSFIKDIIR